MSERDTLLRELVAQWLSEAGATAVTHASAPVDAILVDISCQQDAHATRASWRRAYPHAALVLVSARFAHNAGADDAMASRLGVTRILPKPFSRAALWSALGLTKARAAARPQP
ncbi:MAG: response regulator [Gammaproteobacteria bacterium]|nr:response regulator [Gammaproteobacteria bacterium]MBV9620391.1 response regulator [Gammaproteobacteria bacterium]